MTCRHRGLSASLGHAPGRPAVITVTMRVIWETVTRTLRFREGVCVGPIVQKQHVMLEAVRTRTEPRSAVGPLSGAGLVRSDSGRVVPG